MSNIAPVQRIIGIDPGSLTTGVGIIDAQGDRIKYVYHQAVRSKSKESFPERLRSIHNAVQEIVKTYQPTQVAIEQVFMHKNADSALKLGQARAAAMSATFYANIPVHEYSAKLIKQAVVGKGGAAKNQVQHMVGFLLNINEPIQEDAADALAVAICHSSLLNTSQILNVDLATTQTTIRKRRR